jgi:hypothetical protein
MSGISFAKLVDYYKYLYYENKIHESLISYEESDRNVFKPSGDNYETETRPGNFHYRFFIDQDVKVFNLVLKKTLEESQPTNGDDLILKFLEILTLLLIPPSEPDYLKNIEFIAFIVVNFINFIDMFQIQVRDEVIENLLVNICNGREDLVYVSLWQFKSNGNASELTAGLAGAVTAADVAAVAVGAGSAAPGVITFEGYDTPPRESFDAEITGMVPAGGKRRTIKRKRKQKKTKARKHNKKSKKGKKRKPRKTRKNRK